MRSIVLIILLLAAGPAALAQQPPLGTLLPDLTVENSSGDLVSVQELTGANGTVLVFWSNECNWTQQYERRLMDIAQSANGVSVVLINANDPVAFPGEAEDNNMGLPNLRDSGGQLARALGAVRAPQAYVFDGSRQLVYSGSIDDSAADPDAVEEAWLSDVVAQLSDGSPVTVASTRAFGCRLKLP